MNTDKLRSFSASVFICVHRWFKIEGHLSVATTVGQAVPDMGNRKAISVRHSLTYFNCQKGADDPEILHAMVEANVPADPYWLVSIKPAQATNGQTRMRKVDHRTRKVLTERA